MLTRKPDHTFRGKLERHNPSFITTNEIVSIPPLGLDGHLVIPAPSAPIVIFAHGRHGSQHSPRSRYIAAALNRSGFGTLLFDLLMPQESQDYSAVLDIELLAERLMQASQWLRQRMDRYLIEVGIFGANTGAAAALVAAARKPDIANAIVCRGGRPDLAGTALSLVRIPTLLLVDGNDHEAIVQNRLAANRMRCPTALKIMPDATHSVEGAGTLDQVIDCATFWYGKHLLPAGNA